MKRILSLATLVVCLAGSAAAQELKVNSPYQCRDGSQLRVTNCSLRGRDEACDMESLKDGKWAAFIHASKQTLANAIRACVGPDSPNAPAPPLPAGGRTAQPPAPSASGTASPTGGVPPSNDPATNAARTCVASGRNVMDCLGEAFRISVAGTPLEGTALSPSRLPASIRMIGDFRNAGGAKIQFQANASEATGSARVSGMCGLAADTRKYTVEQSTAAVIRIENSPQPITLTLDATGRLNGAGAIDVLGQVVNGTRQQTTTYPDGRSQTITVPAYEPKSVRCAIGSFTATGDITPEQTLAAPANYALQVFGGVTQQDLQKAGQTKAFKITPGPRALGAYAGQNGAAVEFRADSATVTCGDAVVADSYSLVWRNNQFVATVQTNPAMVFSFGPDKTITGPASAVVSGRVATGMNGPQVLYASKTATCSFGSLRSANQR